MTITRVLVTAFAPWGDRRVNSSELAVEELDGAEVEGARVKVVVLPVDPVAAHEGLRAAARAFQPGAVVSFGMHRGEPGLWKVEMLAHNRFTRTETGAMVGAPVTEIVVGGPRVLPTGLPAARIHGRLLESRLPVEFSEDAGTFVCNQLFYRSLLDVEEGLLPAVTGFVHVPPPEVPEGLAGAESANREALQEGARVIVAAVVIPLPYARDTSV